ncbi:MULTISPECIES: UDP-glucose 4-epimerase GalE [Yersinia]|uniref:UDP-glucose 4-epimerase GalE n=1 Tax=Yersinia TaxID=629 RepID=UPI0005E5C5CD|nr:MULTISPECIES: UDP-glucose 4-epimerase GalE [Yersinia]ARB84272.1 UDP-glucose 4-epimerase GalE [Yersinia sp. FDAARGOS_228]AVL38072.1 UDP-glucose 4-epimerase GalE [Yersinia intermedia]CNC74056.1 UDP-glucose 4-epimerase [Yersinia intermedia]
MSILVTGGAGYIGSHTVIKLLEDGYKVIVLDNLSNSSKKAIEMVERITNNKIDFIIGDILDTNILNDIFRKNKVESVIHFAGLKSVSESINKPIKYYKNNISGTLNLINAMLKAEVYNFIFSSSATVYGLPEKKPLTEDCRTGGTTNPYGESKLIVEEMLKSISNAEPKFNATCLRYFNPVGAHESGLIGEDPNGIPNNLVPYLLQVAIGRLEYVSIYGNDYPTPDGTGIRDYIHVMDLAEGHLAALKKTGSIDGVSVYNLGTGKGYSVFEIINVLSKVSNKDIKYKIAPRRTGDIAECWSDSSLANKELGWKAQKDLSEMIRDSWNWQVKNPNGYKKN